MHFFSQNLNNIAVCRVRLNLSKSTRIYYDLGFNSWSSFLFIKYYYKTNLYVCMYVYTYRYNLYRCIDRKFEKFELCMQCITPYVYYVSAHAPNYSIFTKNMAENYVQRASSLSHLLWCTIVFHILYAHMCTCTFIPILVTSIRLPYIDNRYKI